MKKLVKRLILLTVVLLLFESTAMAALCVTDSLSAYLGLPSTGCTVGDAIFSGFAARNDLLQTGATPVAPTQILVNPLNVSSNPGLEFVVNLAASPGELLEAVIGFNVSGATFDGATLTMDGASATGDAAVTVVEELGGLPPTHHLCCRLRCRCTGAALHPGRRNARHHHGHNRGRRFRQHRLQRAAQRHLAVSRHSGPARSDPRTVDTCAGRHGTGGARPHPQAPR